MINYNVIERSIATMPFVHILIWFYISFVILNAIFIIGVNGVKYFDAFDLLFIIGGPISWIVLFFNSIFNK